MDDTVKILIDAPSLFDLRVGALYGLMSDTDLAKFSVSDDYNFRDTDNFPNIDQTAYLKKLESPSSEILKTTAITYLINLVQAKVKNLEKRNTFMGTTNRPEVVLNLHPLILTETEREAIQNLLFIKLDKAVDITLVDITNKELTPQYLKSIGCVAAFIYEFTEWLSHHTDTLNNNKMPDMLMYFPTLTKVKPEPSELKELNKLGFSDPFVYTEFLYSTVINISFLPVVFYSNLVTSTLHVERLNQTLVKKPLTTGEEDGDIS